MTMGVVSVRMICLTKKDAVRVQESPFYRTCYGQSIASLSAAYTDDTDSKKSAQEAEHGTHIKALSKVLQHLCNQRNLWMIRRSRISDAFSLWDLFGCVAREGVWL